jgi:hypothetical protein
METSGRIHTYDRFVRIATALGIVGPDAHGVGRGTRVASGPMSQVRKLAESETAVAGFRIAENPAWGRFPYHFARGVA